MLPAKGAADVGMFQLVTDIKLFSEGLFVESGPLIMGLQSFQYVQLSVAVAAEKAVVARRRRVDLLNIGKVGVAEMISLFYETGCERIVIHG